MRKVAIIGGGQSGLQLALGLLQNKYEVTLVSNRTPEQILCARVTSSQFMFLDSLQNERDLVINFWEKKCPITEGIALGIAFTIPGPDKTKALFWEAKLDHYGQSVDQRVKVRGLDERVCQTWWQSGDPGCRSRGHRRLRQEP